MRIGDRIRVMLSPMYLAAGAAILVRAPKEPVAWLMGVSFIVYGVYRLALVGKALRPRR
jgi:hypothetical protein